MIITQISIRIEDKAGGSYKVFQTLADNDVNILAYSIADATDYGELRLIVDSINKAETVLNQAGFKTFLTKVYSLNCPNEMGSMSKVLKRLADAQISIKYMYAFQYRGISQAIIRSEEMDKCEKVLTEYERECYL